MKKCKLLSVLVVFVLIISTMGVVNASTLPAVTADLSTGTGSSWGKYNSTDGSYKLAYSGTAKFEFKVQIDEAGWYDFYQQAKFWAENGGLDIKIDGTRVNGNVECSWKKYETLTKMSTTSIYLGKGEHTIAYNFWYKEGEYWDNYIYAIELRCTELENSAPRFNVANLEYSGGTPSEVKVMVWNDLNSLKPVCEAGETTVSLQN